MKSYLRIIFLFVIAMSMGVGCAPLIIGGAAAGGYKVAKDERSVGKIFDDANITATIKTELMHDSIIEAEKIDVDTLEGNVTLTGTLDNQKQVARAIEIAKSIEGVKSVKNNLKVGSKTIGQSVDDKLLGSKIRAKLINEPGVPSTNIDIDVQNGKATLTGIVGDKKTKEKIIRIVQETVGIYNVVDNIKVRQ